MRIVVAPDKFKGSLSATQAAEAIARGLFAVLPAADIETCPMADGGEGTVAAFLERGFSARTARVCGPLGDPVEATFAVQATTAVLEMAGASGLALLPKGRYDARRASSIGTGDLVRAALDAGAHHIVLGIGGSATNDGGAGFAQALGARFYDARGQDLIAGGAALSKLARIDLAGLDPRLANVRIEVACDVDNPLLGPNGASAVYGPQKGASPADVALLDGALAHYAGVVETALGGSWREWPGAGAAGGLGFGLLAFAKATLRAGVDVVAGLVGLADRIAGADLVVSGEGRIDGQTLRGKTVAGVAKIARASGVPVVAFGGSVDPGAEHELAGLGVICLPIVAGPIALDAALEQAGPLLQSAACRLGRLLNCR